MIIGSGDIAGAVKEIDRPDRLFFCSGVSNSLETRESEYQREKDLLAEQRRDLQLVYFSSLCVFYLETRYSQHKLEMESLVKEFPSYAIVRLGLITWGNNPSTLINHLRGELKAGRPLEIQDTTRYIVDKPEFLHWMSKIPPRNVEMCVTGQPMTVKEVVKKYVL